MINPWRVLTGATRGLARRLLQRPDPGLATRVPSDALLVRERPAEVAPRDQKPLTVRKTM